MGGGIAGTTCAEELRKLDPEAQITIISEEPHPLYSRVLLPHYVRGKVPREKCFLKSEGWYEENEVELMTGTYATKLDVDNKFVETDDARELPFDKLVITTGVEPREAESGPRGVSGFWTLDDADQLYALVSEFGPGTKAAIYGGGFISCEYLNIFAENEFATTVFFRGPHFWSKILHPEVGEMFTRHLEANGVTVLPGRKTEGLIGDKDLKGIRTSEGEIECSLLGTGIGTAPILGWLREAGIECNDGVVVNEFMETNVPDVYACGDVAESYDVLAGRTYLAGNWGRAMLQARSLAKTIIGDRTRYAQASSYAINVLGLEVSFVGDTAREAADEVILRGKANSGKISQIFVRDGGIVGAVIMGRNEDRGTLTGWIQNRQNIAEIREKVTDVSQNLK